YRGISSRVSPDFSPRGTATRTRQKKRPILALIRWEGAAVASIDTPVISDLPRSYPPAPPGVKHQIRQLMRSTWHRGTSPAARFRTAPRRGVLRGPDGRSPQSGHCWRWCEWRPSCEGRAAPRIRRADDRATSRRPRGLCDDGRVGGEPSPDRLES